VITKKHNQNGVTAAIEIAEGVDAEVAISSEATRIYSPSIWWHFAFVAIFIVYHGQPPNN